MCRFWNVRQLCGTRLYPALTMPERQPRSASGVLRPSRGAAIQPTRATINKIRTPVYYMPADRRGLTLRGGASQASSDSGRLPYGEKAPICPPCLKASYHSAFYQIHALTSCPRHGATFQDECANCGAFTPQYEPTRIP